MPTFERLPRFDRDWDMLDPADRARFRAIIERLTEVSADGGATGPALPVAAVQGAPGVLELAFSQAARATLSVGAVPGRGPHLVWRRIGAIDLRRHSAE